MVWFGRSPLDKEGVNVGSLFRIWGKRADAAPTTTVSAPAVTEHTADTVPHVVAPPRPLVAVGEESESIAVVAKDGSRIGGTPASNDSAAAATIIEVPAKVTPMLPLSAGVRPQRRVAIENSDETQFAHTVLQGFGNLLIGELLQQQGHLTTEQVKRVLDHQRQHKARFGEAAVALGLVKGNDVLRALSQQFGYDYTPLTTAEGEEELSHELVIARHPFSRAAEMIRDLRSELLAGALNPDNINRSALAVVSLDHGDGKSWLAANLAVSLSQLGAKTLLVDANLRNPRQHEIFGLDGGRGGLSGILNRKHRAEVIKPTRALPNLHVLTAGAVPPNPLETLQGRGFVQLMHKVRTNFTHVIVDTAPASAGADARLVAARSGASLLVARKHKSGLDGLRSFMGLLSKGNAQFAGLVVNEA
ncbi:MAG: polysaccharide biosynthesis tyrosine autokinase [Rubrivivax sp.]|jgi:protein-tyrosine kinase